MTTNRMEPTIPFETLDWTMNSIILSDGRVMVLSYSLTHWHIAIGDSAGNPLLWEDFKLVGEYDKFIDRINYYAS